VKVFVDTAPVMEKPLAEAAGLGWQGKHTVLVSREFGNWLFLGAIFTTAELPPTLPSTSAAAPAGAASTSARRMPSRRPFQLDARRCISYLTIEHKGPIPADLRPAMGNRIFGCDDCLAVCPWNNSRKAAGRRTRPARGPRRAAAGGTRPPGRRDLSRPFRGHAHQAHRPGAVYPQRAHCHR
jgi:epoxyqueuosine reductase